MHNLISRNEAAKCIALQYPEIRKEIQFLSYQKNFAGVIQSVINYLFLLLEEGKRNKVSAKIQRMGWLYKRGNFSIKNLIENLFVRSFNAMKKRCNSKEWKMILEKSPLVFQKLHQNQIKKDEQLKMKL